jgi:hypothetical protein
MHPSGRPLAHGRNEKQQGLLAHWDAFAKQLISDVRRSLRDLTIREILISHRWSLTLHVLARFCVGETPKVETIKGCGLVAWHLGRSDVISCKQGSD